MRLRKALFILIVITTIFLIPITTSAYSPHNSDVYKQGVYDIGGLKEYNVSFDLLTNTKTYVLVVDKNNELLSYLRLPYNEKLTLTNLGDAATIAIIGPGEVAVVYEKK